MDELVSNPNITPSEYKSLYPVFVFDISKQSEILKTQITDIQIKAAFDENVPANTQAYAIVISDCFRFSLTEVNLLWLCKDIDKNLIIKKYDENFD